METVHDIRILLPSIYEEVLAGFQDALAEREENICVLSIGNVENSDIILQVINFMTRSSNIDASDMQYDSNES